MDSKEINSEWFKNHSTEIIALSNVVLVVITIVYVIITSNLSSNARDQMILSSNPHIVIHYDYRPRFLTIKDSILSLSIKNMSQTDLSNISLRLKFYMYYIDSLQNEGFIEYSPSPSFRPDSIIISLNSKSLAKLKMDIRPYYSSLSNTNGYFYFKESLETTGHWKKMDLTKGKNFPFRFLIIELGYYRNLDGEKYTENYYFDVSGSPFMSSSAILFQYDDLDEILNSFRRWSQGLLERDDLLPEGWK